MTTAEVIESVLSACAFESRYLELEITERAFPV